MACSGSCSVLWRSAWDIGELLHDGEDKDVVCALAVIARAGPVL